MNITTTSAKDFFLQLMQGMSKNDTDTADVEFDLPTEDGDLTVAFEICLVSLEPKTAKE